MNKVMATLMVLSLGACAPMAPKPNTSSFFQRIDDQEYSEGVYRFVTPEAICFIYTSPSGPAMQCKWLDVQK
jgi:hypothetical protein